MYADQALQRRRPAHHPHGARCFAFGAGDRDGDDPGMDHPLCRLHQRRGYPTAHLHPGQLPVGHPPGPKRSGQHPRGGDGVGHRQIDSDAADRRHRVRRIADAQHAVGVPAAQPIELHVKQFHVIKRGQRVHPIGQRRHHAHQHAVQRFDALRPHLGVGSLGNDVGDLVVVAAVDQDGPVAGFERAGESGRVVGLTRQSEPPDVHRRAEGPRRQADR